MASEIQIRQVESKNDWNAFIGFPWKVYRNDPRWVPPLRIAVRDLLDIRKNPFFRHAYLHPLLAFRGDECVGRIAGVIDDNHNKFHDEKTAFFGFFESLDDPAVANALLDGVAGWARSKGMRILRGPVNPSTNHECGLLVEGFDDPAAVMMTYNPPYYLKLLEGWGFRKSKDLYAYTLHKDDKVSDRLLAQSERLKKRGSIVVRAVNVKDFDQEVERILDVYNDAWERNWGFVPMEPEEFRHMAKDLKQALDPELLLIAEVKGQVAGFALTLPDVNQAFHKIRDGKLFPTGLLKLLWNLKGPGKKKTINRCRILTLGIKKAYRELGLGAIFYTEYFRRGPSLGYPTGEASWILEDNKPMNRALELMGSRRYKTYRIVDREL